MSSENATAIAAAMAGTALPALVGAHGGLVAVATSTVLAPFTSAVTTAATAIATAVATMTAVASISADTSREIFILRPPPTISLATSALLGPTFTETTTETAGIVESVEELVLEAAGCMHQKGPRFDPNSEDYQLLIGLWIITILCTITATAISIFQIWRHFRHYFKPSHQRLIVRILIMVPIYSISSCLSFRYYWGSIYYDLVRDCYEAFVIFSFYCLLEQYLGDTFEARYEFMQKISAPARVACPFPFNCIKVNPRGQSFLLYTRYLILQYVIVRPCMTVLALILELIQRLCPSSFSPAYGEFWVTTANTISVTVAMYALIMFYIVIHHEIDEYRPLWKFIAIKFVIVFSFWQSILLSTLDGTGVLKSDTYWTAENLSELIQAFLICVEMVIAALIHEKAFSYTEFIQDSVIIDSKSGSRGVMKTRMLPAFKDAFSVTDILKDIGAMPTEIKRLRHRRHLKLSAKKLPLGAESAELSSVDDNSDAESVISMVSVGKAGADGTRSRSVSNLKNHFEIDDEDGPSDDNAIEKSHTISFVVSSPSVEDLDAKWGEVDRKDEGSSSRQNEEP